ncbi:MAG TPA: bifunctional 4-hydroxy-2-oxoglutarate aldolase/2-dehydro-3-deoxy-phosphogluconate aldolase [Chthoniobacterales bacterium]|jgi:2-dehydro-3-deoxyphosphogluconate aldolase/(4S)-4-hydroxy-2-oxoglutarate aldolase|nr:bifunctional 4-hydroxy-2-oxoglutarate aldolase/2-dehydro-3-deoxy-phosphogluconate aldolase [Chthoniobacterales bacterium]
MSSVSLQSIVDDAPIVAIVRRPKVDPVRCIERLFQAGIRLVEITMDTPDALRILESQLPCVPPNALLGAGTVTDIGRAEAALAAGAAFIVTPNVDLEVIRTVRAHGIPVMPGALTPTEICNAVNAGADFVKVFPASTVGPGYFRELRGPFERIPLMASGGVNLENAAEFIKFGADALGIGGALIPKKNDEFDLCTEMARRLLEVARTARASR